jgi:hypothetical protein
MALVIHCTFCQTTALRPGFLWSDLSILLGRIWATWQLKSMTDFSLYFIPLYYSWTCWLSWLVRWRNSENWGWPSVSAPTYLIRSESTTPWRIGCLGLIAQYREGILWGMETGVPHCPVTYSKNKNDRCWPTRTEIVAISSKAITL